MHNFWYGNSFILFDLDILYLLSTFGGTCLAIAMGLIYCYYPMTDMRENPNYWWELQVMLIPGFFPLFLTSGLVQGWFWCNFRYDGLVKSYCILYLFGLCTYAVVNLFYYFIWAEVLGFTPPMPFNNYVAGTTTWNCHHIFVYTRYYQTTFWA